MTVRNEHLFEDYQAAKGKLSHKAIYATLADQYKVSVTRVRRIIHAEYRRRQYGHPSTLPDVPKPKPPPKPYVKRFRGPMR